jgi:purine catabolism regulator
MEMKVKELLDRPSMRDARLLVGGKGLNSQITGVNVLEAVDIEQWGRSGLALLSSYYALEDLSDDELRAFFRKLEEIRISVFIIKVARLVEDSPPLLRDLCGAHGIPLVQIGKDVSYQDLMVDVLGSMLATREQQLSLHYRLSNISSQMSLEMLSLRDILHRFKEFLGQDLSLYERIRRQTISTNSDYSHVTIGEHLEIERSEYMNFHYDRFRCFYAGWDSGQESTLLQVDISVIGDRQHLLIVHEQRNQKVTENEIVIIENLIRCLQTALLREYAGRQQQMMSRNAMIGDLMRGIVTTAAEHAATLESLGVDPDGECRVLTIEYSSTDEDTSLQQTNVKNRIRWTMQAWFADALFYIAPSYIHVFMPGKQGIPIGLPVERITTFMKNVIKEEGAGDSLQFFGGISDQRPVREIAQAGATSRATARFLRTNGKPNMVEEYDNLGVFKLFIQSGHVDMQDYVPDVVRDLHESDPDLFDTLRAYIYNRQSLTRTAEVLHLHPKTVKYRVSKLPARLKMDLADPHALTILTTAIEIIQFSAREGSRGIAQAS